MSERVKGYVYRCTDRDCGEESKPFRAPSTRGVVCQCGARMSMNRIVRVDRSELIGRAKK